VTHSLGGIIFRHLGDGLHWKRAVMLAPPNNGSAIARAVSAAPATARVFRYLRQTTLGGLAGPAGTSREWPFPPAPFAVIAGTKRFAAVNPTSWWSHRIFGKDEEHDGTVAVEETKLEGMASFATVKASHTTIMDEPAVHELVITFLRNGYFKELQSDRKQGASNVSAEHSLAPSEMPST
jgi:triacylglycerol esterase/lipase EstA (alpha/beta hydrolase family)